MTQSQQQDPVDRLLRTQVKLFEKAHEKSVELKPLGLAVKRQGIDLSRLYCNPNYLLLPLNDCPHLSKLSPEQLSVLTAIFFAGTYSEIATSETVALRYNMVASELAFPIYSDNYMVLFHETAEEYDHIITFRAVCQGLIGRGDVIGVHLFPHIQPVYDTFDLYKGRLCNNGFGGMYLLMRYMLNLALKQLEGFMCTGLPTDRAMPVALEIVTGHSTDEARHLTTSLDLGLGLFRKATKASRDLISGLLRIAIYSMIENRFGSDLTRAYHYGPSLAVLRQALARPQFEGFPLTVEELQALWAREGIGIQASPEYENSRRWLAMQIRRLAEAMELKLTPRGEAFERYLQYAQPAGTAPGMLRAPSDPQTQTVAAAV